MPRVFYKSTFAPDTPPLPNPPNTAQGGVNVYPDRVAQPRRQTAGEHRSEQFFPIAPNTAQGWTTIYPDRVAQPRRQTAGENRSEQFLPNTAPTPAQGWDSAYPNTVGIASAYRRQSTVQVDCLTPPAPAASNTAQGWEAVYPSQRSVSARPSTIQIDWFFNPAPAQIVPGWEALYQDRASVAFAYRQSTTQIDYLPPMPITPRGWEQSVPAVVRSPRPKPQPTVDVFYYLPTPPQGWELVVVPGRVLSRAPNRTTDSNSTQPFPALLSPSGWDSMYPSIVRRPRSRQPDLLDFRTSQVVLSPQGWDAASVDRIRRTAPQQLADASILLPPLRFPQGWDAVYPLRIVRPGSQPQPVLDNRGFVAVPVPQGWSALYPDRVPTKRPQQIPPSWVDFYFRAAVPGARGWVKGTMSWLNRITGTLTFAPRGSTVAAANSPLSPQQFYIDRDYVGTLVGAVLFGNIPADAGAVVNWYLYDSANNPLGTGTGAYVSSPTSFQVVIPYTAFGTAAIAAAIAANGYARGRVHVTLGESGQYGSWGSPVVFQYPTATAT